MTVGDRVLMTAEEPKVVGRLEENLWCWWEVRRRGKLVVIREETDGGNGRGGGRGGLYNVVGGFWSILWVGNVLAAIPNWTGYGPWSWPLLD